jgi:preprotein translocase subunit SecG
MNILLNFLLAIYVLVALLMLLVILMQRPKSEGLGAAFGGGVTENIFGAQTTNVLTKATAWLAGVFFLLTFALSILYAHRSMASSSLRRELLKTEAAASTGKSKNATQGTAAATQTPVSPAPAAAAVGVVPPASAPVAPSSAPSSPTPPKP